MVALNSFTFYLDFALPHEENSLTLSRTYLSLRQTSSYYSIFLRYHFALPHNVFALPHKENFKFGQTCRLLRLLMLHCCASLSAAVTGLSAYSPCGIQISSSSSEWLPTKQNYAFLFLIHGSHLGFSGKFFIALNNFFNVIVELGV